MKRIIDKINNRTILIIIAGLVAIVAILAFAVPELLIELVKLF